MKVSAKAPASAGASVCCATEDNIMKTSSGQHHPRAEGIPLHSKLAILPPAACRSTAGSRVNGCSAGRGCSFNQSRRAVQGRRCRGTSAAERVMSAVPISSATPPQELFRSISPVDPVPSWPREDNLPTVAQIIIALCALVQRYFLLFFDLSPSNGPSNL